MATQNKKKTPAKKAVSKKQPVAIARRTKDELNRARREAYTYYVEHQLEQKAIAKITGISEQSISKWKEEDNWDADREMINIGVERTLRRVIKHYDALLTQIEQREPPYNVPDSKEADALNKLADSVNKLKTEILLGHKTAVGKEFCSFLFTVHGKAKSIEVMELWHEYIMNDGK